MSTPSDSDRDPGPSNHSLHIELRAPLFHTFSNGCPGRIIVKLTSELGLSELACGLCGSFVGLVDFRLVEQINEMSDLLPTASAAQAARAKDEMIVEKLLEGMKRGEFLMLDLDGNPMPQSPPSNEPLDLEDLFK